MTGFSQGNQYKFELSKYSSYRDSTVTLQISHLFNYKCYYFGKRMTWEYIRYTVCVNFGCLARTLCTTFRPLVYKVKYIHLIQFCSCVLKLVWKLSIKNQYTLETNTRKYTRKMWPILTYRHALFRISLACLNLILFI